MVSRIHFIELGAEASRIFFSKNRRLQEGRWQDLGRGKPFPTPYSSFGAAAVPSQ